MAGLSRALLIALLLGLVTLAVVTRTVQAQDDDDDGIARPASDGGHAGETPPADPHVEMPAGNDAEVEEEPEPEPTADESDDGRGVSGVFARATFPGKSDAVFHAGDPVPTFVTFENAAENNNYNVVFIVAHLSPLGDSNYFIQNFTGVLYGRSVAGGETATFKYTFTPHHMLDPRDYNLVVRLFFQNDDNTTYVAPAFNGTCTILEPEGTDPQTIMTFCIILALGGAVAFYFLKIRPSATVKKVSSTVEMGTSGQAFDKDYISKEHLAFAEALQQRKTSSSPKARAHSK